MEKGEYQKYIEDRLRDGELCGDYVEIEFYVSAGWERDLGDEEAKD